MNDENFIVIGFVVLLIGYFLLLFISPFNAITKAIIFFGSITVLAHMLKNYKNTH